MNRYRIFACVALLLVCGGQVVANTLEKARRITGHYAPGSVPSQISMADWDPSSEEGRKYIGPMQKEPSRLFRNRTCACQTINSLEDLEDLVYDMHKKLHPRLAINLGPDVNKTKLDEWLKKVNTLQYLYASVVEEKKQRVLCVYYKTDARVFAAFRNPEMEERLNNKERDLLEVCAQWIVGNIQPEMPNMLKVRLVHDALVDNCKYTPGFYDTYNMVVNGKGVCAAYTSSTQLLLHMLKVDCRSVMGTPKMNHIWNIIDVNGEWYQTDVTWDDPITKRGKDVKRFNYYLLTDVEMAMDHEWNEAEIYPHTPEINRVSLFKRQAFRSCLKSEDCEEECTNPREKESIFKILSERFQDEAEKNGDRVADTVEPVTAPVSAVGGSVSSGIASSAKSFGIVGGGKRSTKRGKKAEYKTIASLDDLYENLRICQDYLDGPVVEFQVGNTCPSFLLKLLAADYYHYIKYWNYLYDKKKNILKLQFEHWPHIRLLRSVDDDENAAKLTPEERSVLKMCQALAYQYGTAWKLDKQKMRDVYTDFVQKVDWTPGASDLLMAINNHRSGSLGYSEALHTVLSLMKIPCIMVHGRSHQGAHAWNLVRRANGRWYHAAAAMDDAAGKTSEHTFKYFLRCDDEVAKELVWDLEETHPTPLKSQKRANEYGLLDRRREPEHVPEPENAKYSIIP